MYIVKCNNCDTAMQVVLKEVNTRIGRVGYFICPGCGEIYIGYVNSPAFLSLVKRKTEILQDMQEAGRNRDNRLYDRYYKKLLKTRRKMDKQQRTLKEQARKEIEMLIEQGKTGR